MKTAWFVALLILSSVGFGLIDRALAQSASDPVKQELDAAKSVHTAALSKAATSLAAAFDVQVRSLNSSGDADSVKLLSAQKSAFISAGTLPQSPLMKQAVAQYQQSVKDADDKLLAAYSTAIEGFNKESKLDLATQARKERSDLLAPPVVGGATGGNSSGAIPTPEAIAKELEAAKTQNRQDIDDAKKALLNTIDERITAATDAGNLALVTALQAVQATAAVDGTVPDDVKDAAVIVAKKTYDTALATAKSKLNLAYQKAIRDYTRARQIALAQSTQNELNSLGLVDATAPTAMTAGTFQLGSKLPDFLTAKDSAFVALGDRLGVIVPTTNYIRTKEGDLLSKNFTFDVWFYMVKGMRGYAKLPPALVGLGEGTANPVNGGPLDSLYLEINPPDQNGGEVNLHQRQISTKTTIGHLTEFDTYVARIQKSGNSVTFIVGTEQSGTLVPEVSITIDDVRSDSPYLNDTNGHLFFGSGAFRQLSIGKGPAPVTAIAGATQLTEARGEGTAGSDSGEAGAGTSSGFNNLGAKLQSFFVADDGFVADKIGIHFDGRHYIRTKKADYISHDFVFDVRFDIKAGDSIAFVGIGEGTPGRAGEPAGSVMLRMHAPDLGDGLIHLSRGPSGGFTLGHHQAGGTYLARVEKNGNAVTFSVDTDWNGKTFDPLYTQTIPDITKYASDLNDKNSHLFFGGGGRFRQFRILDHLPDAGAPAGGVVSSPQAGDVTTAKPAVLPGTPTAPAAGASQLTQGSANPSDSTRPPAPSPTPEKNRVVNLLKLVNPAKDSVHGSWSLVDGKLNCEALNGARIEFQYRPPAEYDYKLAFVRTTGNESLNIVCVEGNRQFTYVIAGLANKVSGLSLLDGHRFPENPTTQKLDAWVVNGRQYISVVKIRKDRVQVTLDGKLICDWKTDYRDLSLPDASQLRRKDTVGIMTWGSKFSFSTIEINEVSGPGEVLGK